MIASRIGLCRKVSHVWPYGEIITTETHKDFFNLLVKFYAFIFQFLLVFVQGIMTLILEELKYKQKASVKYKEVELQGITQITQNFKWMEGMCLVFQIISLFEVYLVRKVSSNRSII